MVLYICFILYSIINKSHQHLLEALDDNALNKLLVESSWPIRFNSKPYLYAKSGLPLSEVNNPPIVYRRIRYNGQSNIDGKLGEVIFLTADHKFQAKIKRRSKSKISYTNGVHKQGVINKQKHTAVGYEYLPGNTQGFLKQPTSNLVPTEFRQMQHLKKREMNMPMFPPRQHKPKHFNIYRKTQTNERRLPLRSGLNRSPLRMYFRKQQRFPSHHKFNPLTVFKK
ncbi:unnamed protein product [Mytilus coruscus]|uniref:Uncharacterized protein n=1 Tax=Mytilus coruscus TaxID=42192 RepID=A0A6J8E4A3_MYTCO|nr:unnamed protein product [Mytilus coruscus]